MASLLTKLANRLGPHTEAKARSREPTAGRHVAAIANARQRSLLSALTTNDAPSWQPGGLHINAETEAGLATVIARSRDAARNNPFAGRFIGMVRRNLLGPHCLEPAAENHVDEPSFSP